MNFISILLYLLSATSVFITFYLSYTLYRKYQAIHLLHYLYFITAFFVAGFIDLVGTHLAAMMLVDQEPLTVMLLKHIFAILVFPFIPLAAYFLFSFMSGFTERRIPKHLRYAYGAFWILLFFALVVVTKNFLSSEEAGASGYLFSTLDTIPYVFYSAVPVWGLVVSRGLEEAGRKRAVGIFCLIALVGFAVSWALTTLPAGHSLYSRPLHMFIYFSINLPSLLSVRFYLSKNPPAPDAVPLIEGADLDSFFERFALSNREREIVRLMLTGKSNKEIAAELFVSTHTVKNHVYNIYQKLQVSNRLHFLRVVQRFIRGRTE